MNIPLTLPNTGSVLAVVLAILQVSALFTAVFGIAAIIRRTGASSAISVAVAVAIWGALAMALFWVAWAMLPSHLPARAISFLFIAVSFGLGILGLARKQWADEFAWPIAVAALASLGLFLWVHCGQPPDASPLHIGATRWTHALPGDNEIPLRFAQSFVHGYIPKGASGHFYGDWLSSDRPPLQTALFLLTPGYLFYRANEWAYQSASIAMQMFALLGTWVLFRSFSSDRRLALAAMVAVFFTPLVLVNGAFVWPKLLAAACVLAACGLHFSKEAVSCSWRIGIAVGALAALGMLAHGGTAFALIGMAVAAIALFRLGNSRYVLAVAASFLTLYGPWIAYQKFVDPPGDRLLKWHLAGVRDIDSRPFLQTIRDSYASKSLSDVINVRMKNIGIVLSGVPGSTSQTIAAATAILSGDINQAKALLFSVRKSQFFLVPIGTGILGLAIFCLPVGLFFPNTRAITIAIIGTFAAWIGLTFLPSYTVIHQGSFFPEIALIVVALLWFSERSNVLAWTAIAAQVALTVFQYAI